MSFDRIFASPDLGDKTTNYANMREWEGPDREAMDEIRGGGGDEIEYDAMSDTFRFALGSGIGPMCSVSNPRPGMDLVIGAKLVARFADLCWDEMEAGR